MRLVICMLVAVATVVCGKETDALDQLAAKLSASHGLWVNGVFQPIKLPGNTPIQEVVSHAIGKRFPGYKILKIREVHIEGPLPDLYTGVLLQIHAGEKILLLQYSEKSKDWWNRVYDVSSPSEKSTKGTSGS